MNQNIICGAIASVKNKSWIKESTAQNIVLTDMGDRDSPIDILISADVARKLMTGRKHILKNGLTAFKTFLDWTVMGKVQRVSHRTDTTLMITT